MKQGSSQDIGEKELVKSRNLGLLQLYTYVIEF